MDQDQLYKFSIPLQQKASHEVSIKLAQGFQRKSHSIVWTDDGWQVITIANPESLAPESEKTLACKVIYEDRVSNLWYGGLCLH